MKNISQVRLQFSDQVWGQVWGQVYDQVLGQVRRQVSDSLRKTQELP
jgi:hypothetical protein